MHANKYILTLCDVLILYLLVSRQQKIHFKEFQKFLEELSTSKKVPPGKMKEKLTNCGAPGHKSNASVSFKAIHDTRKFATKSCTTFLMEKMISQPNVRNSIDAEKRRV